METVKTCGTVKSCKSVKTREDPIETKSSYGNDKSQWALGTVRAGQGPGAPGRAPGPARAGQGREGPARAEDEVHIAKRAGQGPEPQVR